MLEATRIDVRAGPELHDRHAARQEIDSIQLYSLSKLTRNSRATTFLHRAASRLEEEFLGQPLHKKLWFLRCSLVWAARRVRRKIVSSLAVPPTIKKSVPTGHLRIAVHGTGSLGDFISHGMFMQEFHRQFGPMHIDFFSHFKKIEEAKFVFAQAPFVKNVINVDYLPLVRDKYDAVVESRYLIRYDVINYWKLLEHNSDLLNSISVASQRSEPYRFVFDSHPLLDGMFARSSANLEMNLADVIGYYSNLDVNFRTIPYLYPDVSRYDVIAKYQLARTRYITVHDGCDLSNILLNGVATKQWPIEHWNRLVAQIKRALPGITIVQLGATNSRKIEGTDLDLRNMTTLDEAAWILKHSSLHVDSESGLVRLAHALHTRSVVLFGPTSPGLFAFDQNVNIVSASCSDCWWSTPNWVNTCPRGLPGPACMESIKPEQVLEAVEDWFSALQPAHYNVVQISRFAAADIEVRDKEMLADVFTTLDLAVTPRCQDAMNRDIGLRVVGNKQWHYLKALQVVDEMAAELGRPLKIAYVNDGGGALAAYLAIKGHDLETFASDYCWDGDHDTEYRFRTWAKKNSLKVSFGSSLNIPAESEIYDLVILLDIAHVVPHAGFAVKEALRLLRSGGKLIVGLGTNQGVANKKGGADAETYTPSRLIAALTGIGIEPRLSKQAEDNLEHARSSGDAGISDEAATTMVIIRRD
jgi:ADP-heptose:LPS heptosyltransferase/SAM-dependent methyltransferase